jgi:hypothetical protein
VSTNVLQLAVGTATLFGGTSAATTGLNVVTTYRQGSGNTEPGASGAAVDSPALTLPNALAGPAGTASGVVYGTHADPSTIVTGPASTEIGTDAMTFTGQASSASNPSTFGISGQASGLGLEPFNYDNLGSPDSNVPYPVPIYDAATGTDPNQLGAAWGGPPAFDLLGTGQSPVGSGIVPGGTAGLSMGLDVFEGVAPAAGGTYSLAVSLPANTGTATTTKSFTLPGSLTQLPAFTAPAPTVDASGDGGASIAVTLPAGVTEAYVEILDFGPGPFGAMATPAASCNGSSAGGPVYYTIEVTASGAAALPPTAGPSGTPSLCTSAQNTAANTGTATPGDTFTVQGIGFDYPIYEASYTTSTDSGNASPALLGANGEDDITISSAACYFEAAAATTAGACPAGTLPLVHVRRGAAAAHGEKFAPSAVRRR